MVGETRSRWWNVSGKKTRQKIVFLSRFQPPVSPFRAIAQIPEYRQISILAYCTCFATVLLKNEYQFWRTRKINFGGAVWEPPLLGLCRIYIRCCFAVCAQTIGWRLKEKVDPPVSTRKKERSNSSMV